MQSAQVTELDKFTRLRELLARVVDLQAAASVLSWDQETYMPPDAAESRAHQIATVRRLAHELFTSDEIGVLLDELGPVVRDMNPQSTEAALVRVVKRDYEKALKLPASLVSELAEAVSLGKEAWKMARATDRFATFAPQLERLVELNVRKAEAYGYEEELYDALLDEYEPGMTTAEVRSIFGELRRELVPIVETIASHPEIDDAVLHRHYERQKQWDFGLAVARDFGYDLRRGRQDVAAHPFSTTFSIHDVRITTRISEDFLSTGLYGTLHEAGHALYEQGVDPMLERTPLADGTSLSIHESQSRLWENLVGRSRAFWRHYYPALQRLFPDQLRDVPLEGFYRAVNKVKPGLIRVEADEVTYNLHVMLRFELEPALLKGELEIRDLPETWNERMVDFLGVRPPSDADGVLQDIHWSLGAFGYFPTYTLGNLASTQIFDAAVRDIPAFDEMTAEGEFGDLLSWLREKIHRHGRKMAAPELLMHATGEPLSAASWLAYVRRKYGELYEGLAETV